MWYHRERGQALVEFAITFPLQLFITFVIIEICLFFIGDVLVSHAALRACRTVEVADFNSESNRNDTPEMLAKRAAQIILAPISFSSGTSSAERVTIPGWGPLKGSDYAFDYLDDPKISQTSGSDGENVISVTISYHMPIVLPAADRIFKIAVRPKPDDPQTALPPNGTWIVERDGKTFLLIHRTQSVTRSKLIMSLKDAQEFDMEIYDGK